MMYGRRWSPERLQHELFGTPSSAVHHFDETYSTYLQCYVSSRPCCASPGEPCTDMQWSVCTRKKQKRAQSQPAHYLPLQRKGKILRSRRLSGKFAPSSERTFQPH